MITAAATADEREEAQAQYKASLILKLLEYVTWPEGSGPGEGEAIVIGVVGDSPLLDKLNQLANFSSLDPKPVVRSVSTEEELADIHVAFLSTEDETELKQDLENIGELRILTLSDKEGFVELGVMVNFMKDLDATSKEKFEVNISAVKNAEMKISSRFLKLAKIHDEG
jgi:hypothetical protein